MSAGPTRTLREQRTPSFVIALHCTESGVEAPGVEAGEGGGESVLAFVDKGGARPALPFLRDAGVAV